MFNEIDDKGKIFTNVVTKRPIRVVVQTTTQRIQGQIHVTPSERLKDELNHSEQYIALTNATVTELSGDAVFQCNFLTLNRDYIVWIIPEEDLIQG